VESNEPFAITISEVQREEQLKKALSVVGTRTQEEATRRRQRGLWSRCLIKENFYICTNRLLVERNYHFYKIMALEIDVAQEFSG